MVGLEDVTKYPEVFAALIDYGEFEWLAGLNLTNAFTQRTTLIVTIYILLPCRSIEEVNDMLAEVVEKAVNSWIPVADMGNDTACNTHFSME